MKRFVEVMVRRSRVFIFAVVLLAAIGIAGIQPASIVVADGNSQAAQPMEVDIALNEWNLVPPDWNLQAGDSVVFNITNTGQFPHALEVGNSAIHLHSPTIGANETTTLEVTFDFGGSYTFLCPIPGHAALGMVGTLNVEGGDPAPESDEFLGTPLMRISPRSGTMVEGTSQEVRTILHDFTLSPDAIGGANVGGEGHWALFLDDELVDSIGEPAYMLEDLTPGEHTVRVELRNNDGTPLEPALSASSTVTVPAPAVVEEEEEPEAPSVGDSLVPIVAYFALGIGAALLVMGGLTLAIRRRVS